MITHLSIKDFAIINSVSLSFREGLHILTGETGAGKSILIEAINLALGSRADTAYIQSGKEKAVIEMGVHSENPEVFRMLSENGLPVEKDLLISREIQLGGKSVCRINGDMVSVAFLNKLGKKIADLHGQYDHQSLLNPEHHLTLVDNYDTANIEPLLETVKQLFFDYQSTKSNILRLEKNKAESLRNRDFMQFELDEIKSAQLTVGEDEELAGQVMLLQNHEVLHGHLSAIYGLLFENTPSCFDDLGKSLQLFQEIEPIMPSLKPISEEVGTCYYQLEGLKSSIRNAKDSISFSSNALDTALGRIDQLDRLKRKYGGSLGSVLDYAKTLQHSLEQIEDSDRLFTELSLNLHQLEEQLTTASLALSELRQQISVKLEEQMNQELSELNFKDTVLTVSITQERGPSGLSFSENGIDRIEFLILTNKGESPKPLAKIASGGEISRIMLALKRIVGDFDQIPTMIFDEIDSGISGMTASIVGRKLKQISTNHQVICITHLAQIASYSDSHYQITKGEQDGRTISKVIPLNREEKVLEIARLLGGLDVTESSIRNAEELISQATL